MADSAHDFQAYKRLATLENQVRTFGGGGSGGDNSVMESRVKALEEAVKNLPTKTDFAELRADMHKNTIEIQRWMITTVIALFLGFSGLFFTMNNSSKTSAPTAGPSQQPIIITIPSATPPATVTSPQQ